MTTQATVRKGRKFDQVLKGAREIFLRDGFEGASVDDISREAGVSKATLYNYFPDKRLLFMEVCSVQCHRQADEALLTMDFTQPPEVVLKEAAQRFVEFMLSDMGQKMFKICVAEADRFPEIGQKFYESGPMVVRQAMATYLKDAQSRGELSIDDFDMAADQFGELCKADVWLKLVFGVQTSFSDAEIDRVIENAVATFLARYGV
ncbi:MAG: TetR/AcrR family transcriptional regulator [Pelagimonas sp.]|jgi:AcrR family transcriptional regulator|nr:TetR/AcrR family transcriptional regulator [Pelagimonas sp.]